MKNNIEQTNTPKTWLVDVIGMILFVALIQIPLREGTLLTKVDSKTSQSIPVVNDISKTKMHVQP